MRPLREKMKTRVPSSSWRTSCTNSLVSSTLSSQSRMICSHGSEAELSLYAQCAAAPYSAMWCIACVRIWISSGCVPTSTVVCSERYPLGFGLEM